jgi:uncharacterized protein with ParB-like and HNH nuclease domain
MALTLNAEQKNISNIFGSKNQYIIPEYQRPYSWEETQCRELFDDILKAFRNQEVGYFLGNIVVAKSIDEDTRLEVIDGQQRLTTLTLLMRVLFSFDSDNKKLKNLIWELDDRTDNILSQRLITQVFSDKDATYLNNLLEVNFRIEDLQDDKSNNQYITNTLYFYNAIKDKNNFRDIYEIQKFVDYILYDISLLPIQTEGTNKDDAREKALKIFETINDRGKSLTDSDIFKAKLYSKALNKKEDNLFIKRWNTINDECSIINYKLDEIFKYYTHVIRGERKKTGSEMNLRDFFTRDKDTPFDNKEYDQVLDDLTLLIESIKLYDDVIQKSSEFNEITKYFQLIKIYTNQYPLIALIIFIYKNNITNAEILIQNKDRIISFCQQIIRISYKISVSNKLQFPIYNIIVSIMLGEDIKPKLIPYTENDLKSLGNRKRAYALLAFYLNPKQNAISPHYIDKIINERDKDTLNESWNNINYIEYSENLGNLLIIDSPKKSITLDKKLDVFKKSAIIELNSELLNKCKDWSYQDYLERNESIESRLLEFFNESFNELT